MITFGKKTLFSFLLGAAILTSILELAHINFLYTTTLISFGTYILLPGFLISLILHFKKLSLWENLLIIVGLSVAFLELGGLLLNILLPLLGVNDPLAFQNVVFGFTIFMVLLFILAWIRTKQLVIQVSGQSHLPVRKSYPKPAREGQFVKPGFVGTSNEERENGDATDVLLIQLRKHSHTENVLYTLPLFFPVLAIFGAIVLNNGGSNILTVILLGSIAVYSFLLVLFRAKITVHLYPYALFWIGLASLFTTSLRSWYITGHDIEEEYYVFQLTNTHHIWKMAFYQDAYNACLSITILPTVLTHLLSIQDIYVFRVIFQILFALTPVLVFFLVKNITTPVFSFLSAFFFISFRIFYNDMPMLNRQEIGFIFFGLVLFVMLISEISLPKRRILFIVFTIGVILSHYSTNFILLALVTFVYVSTIIVSLPFVKNLFIFLSSKSFVSPKNTFTNKVFLSFPLVLMLFCITFFWNTLYTKTSDHASSVLTEVVNSLLVKSKSDVKATDLSYSIIFSPPKQDPEKELQKYISGIRQSTDLGKGNTSTFYSQSITSKYTSYPVPQEKLAPTSLGQLLNTLSVPVFDIQAGLWSLSASFLQIFVFIGFFSIFLFNRKKLFDVQKLLLFRNQKTYDMQYLFLCVGAFFLLALLIVLPAISVEYGVLRMFQQFLFLLAFPIVLGLNSILSFIKEQKRIPIIGLMAVILFLNLTGFTSHITGDYYPQMYLDNSGLYYDAYYVHKSDVLAIVWLSKSDSNNQPVVADLSGTNKLLAYGGIFALNELFPAIIPQNAYVYLEVHNNTVAAINNNIFIFNSSKSFLDTHKNLIYSNGQNVIYK